MQTGSKSEEQQGSQVPLIEQLRSVPLNAHHFVEIGPTHHRNIPYGPWCHAAADEIERLRNEVNELRTANAIWEQTNGH